MTEYVYQVVAKGHSKNGWPFSMRSKRVFKSKLAAEAYMPEFREACTDESYFECAFEEGLELTILALELSP